MIVHDDETLDQALQMIESLGTVRYSDHYAYVVVTTPGSLEKLCRSALERGDIAIVVPREQEHEMEEHAKVLLRVQKVRTEEEKRKIKEWVREHPKQVEKFKTKL